MSVSTCIYCPDSTGSREHLLSACLGGRRTCREMLCDACNKRLGPLDSELGQVLGPIGAALGVRGDHDREPQPAIAFDRRLRRVFRKDRHGVLDLAVPIIWELGRGKDRRLKIGGSQAQLDRARHAARQVELGGIWSDRLTEEAIAFDTTQNIRYGGKMFRRAVAKIALHVFAWKEPELARHPALKRLKNWIMDGDGDYEGVWHDVYPDQAHIPRPGRPFAHRVLITFDAESGQVDCRVTFFHRLSVGVHLGTLPVSEKITRILDFDPLAERPGDLHETNLPGVSVKVRPTKDTYDPKDLVAQIDDILQAAAMRAWTETTRGLVSDLNALRTDVPAAGRAEAIAHRLGQEEGRVLSLLAGVARWARIWYPGKEQAESVRRIRRLVAQSRTGPKMVAPRTWRAAGLVRQALAQHLARRLTYRPIQAPELRAYFEGLIGHQIAFPILAVAARVPPPTVRREELMPWLRSMPASA